MIAALPDAREVPGFSVGQVVDAETGAVCPVIDASLRTRLAYSRRHSERYHLKAADGSICRPSRLVCANVNI